jgi:hypothetical protein
VLGWPKRKGFIDKLIGEKVEGIVSNSDKTTFICYLEKPLVLSKRIVVAVPPLAEHENGFEHWLLKISKFAQELSIPIQINCNKVTEESINKVVKLSKVAVSISYNLFEDWEDFLVFSRNVKENDLFVLISARKGATSYMSILDNLPSKLEKHFSINNKIVVYPQQFSQNFMSERYDDISSESIHKGIETIQKLGKGIGNIFKKD